MLCSALSFAFRAVFGAKLMVAVGACRSEPGLSGGGGGGADDDGLDDPATGWGGWFGEWLDSCFGNNEWFQGWVGHGGCGGGGGGGDDDDASGEAGEGLPSIEAWERVGVAAWVPKCVATLALLYLLRRRRNAPQQVTQATVRYDGLSTGPPPGETTYNTYYATHPNGSPGSPRRSGSGGNNGPASSSSTTRKPHIQLVTQV